MNKAKDSTITLLLLFFFLWINIFSCSSSRSDQENILEIYGNLVESYQQEDLRGIMMPVSKKFFIEESQGDYSSLKKDLAHYILNNSNVSLSLTDIAVSINDNTAEVQYYAVLESNESLIKYKAVDYLKKKWGNWKIVSWDHEN